MLTLSVAYPCLVSQLCHCCLALLTEYQSKSRAPNLWSRDPEEILILLYLYSSCSKVGLMLILTPKSFPHISKQTEVSIHEGGLLWVVIPASCSFDIVARRASWYQLDERFGTHVRLAAKYLKGHWEHRLSLFTVSTAPGPLQRWARVHDDYTKLIVKWC